MKTCGLSRFGAALAAAACALATATAAGAQTWPARAVTIVVPFGPGASNDTFTRAIAQVISKKLGQPFVIDNRPGAGGVTGANQVVRAAPDGYTFVEMPSTIAAAKETMKVDLVPNRDLQTIAIFARSPSALVVPASSPAKTLREFIDLAKTNPDKTFFGFTGVGATQHLHGVFFNSMAGLHMRGINYKSSAEAQTDLVAGRLQMMFATVASVLGQIQGGQLRLLAYTADTSPPGAPKAPTMAEAGLDGMDTAQIWWGLFAPKAIPADIAKQMNAAVNDALRDPAVVALMANTGATPMIAPIDEAELTVDKEIVTMSRIIKEAGIKFE
jgi:tripartite-type tricarboxylate transporter receptor subunit TctC